MHICFSKLTIIGSDNGLSPGRRQAIIWTSVGILLIAPLGTNFGEILIEILTFSFKKMHLKVSSAKRQPFCLGLNVLTCNCILQHTSTLRWCRYFIVLLVEHYLFALCIQWHWCRCLAMMGTRAAASMLLMYQCFSQIIPPSPDQS